MAHSIEYADATQHPLHIVANAFDHRVDGHTTHTNH
jgi:hypothetical protein